VASTRALAHAPWSASKVQTALKCPRLFHYRYVERVPEPEVMPETRIGKAVHAALELCLGGTPLGDAAATARTALEGEIERGRYDGLVAGLPGFLTRIEEFRRRRRIGRELIEHQVALRDSFTPTAFYAGDAFYRGVLDLGFVYDDNLAMIDHKTGVRSMRLGVVEQLEGYAVLAIAAFRAVRRIWLGVHWVAAGDVTWAEPISPRDVDHVLKPRLLGNIEAAALAVEGGPRPNPGVWCERCSYRSVCPAGLEFRFEPVDDDGRDDDEDD
jgi:CRISPR/Cas system-associated exonuclease Cas4 (RecB family)